MNEIKLAEDYLTGKATPEDSLLFQAQMIINPELSEQVQHQQRAYNLVQQYGRQQLKANLEAVHQQLFTMPKYARFRQRILDLFKKS